LGENSLETDYELEVLVDDCQPYPRAGVLFQNLDLGLEDLIGKLSRERGRFYAYIVDSLDERNGEYCQRGTGPNFQGDVLTLCTCKHRLRSSPNVQRDTWIAGLSGSPLTQKFFVHLQPATEANALFFLAKVLDYAVSQADLWKMLGKRFPREVRQNKAANLHVFGDVFQPIEGSGSNRVIDPFSPSSYVSPVRNHPHYAVSPDTGKPRWYKDINYTVSRRRQKFLVADPSMTFIWTRPTICRKGNIGRPGGGQGVWPGGVQQFLTELVRSSD
jgi:hypothetical protein